MLFPGLSLLLSILLKFQHQGPVFNELQRLCTWLRRWVYLEKKISTHVIKALPDSNGSQIQWQTSLMVTWRQEQHQIHGVLRSSQGLGGVAVWMWNVPHRLSCLNTGSPAGWAVHKGLKPLGGEASMEKEGPWGWALRLGSTVPLPNLKHYKTFFFYFSWL